MQSTLLQNGEWLQKRDGLNRFNVGCFLGYFIIGLIIAYQAIFKQDDSDLIAHIYAISKIGKVNFPQMGFEYTVYALSKISRLNIQITAIFLFSFALGCQAYITYFVINKLVLIKNWVCLLFTIVTMTCFSLYVPLHQIQQVLSHYIYASSPFIIDKLISTVISFFSDNAYTGIGSPNEWTSPTLIMVKPLGLIITYLYLSQKNNKTSVLISILLAISCFYKPSFATIFVPAVMLHEFYKNTFVMALKRICIMIIPACLILACMFFVLSFVFKMQNGEHTQIILDPFGVIHFYAKNAIGAFVQALFFPILIFIICFRKIIHHNQFLLFSWLMLFFGYLYWALFAQTGHLYADANFKWGYELGLSFVFIFSIIEYLKLGCRLRDDQASKKLNTQSNKKSKILFFILTLALCLQFLAGIGCLSSLLFKISFLKVGASYLLHLISDAKLFI